MRLKDIPRKKKIALMILLFLPLIIAVSLLVYLKMSHPLALGEQLSPAENGPLFIGILIFTAGYLIFLGMLFSENIIDIIKKRSRS